MKAATQAAPSVKLYGNISIHAAREGGDDMPLPHRESYRISIHAAREGGDGVHLEGRSLREAFQSTPPVKAATYEIVYSPNKYRISIHAAREGGDILNHATSCRLYISIHAAREGGDVQIIA